MERALQDWLRASGILDQYREKVAEEAETTERAELARLQKKFA